MDRVCLALVTKRLKQYEAALLERAEAEASGVNGSHTVGVTTARANLYNALILWERDLARLGVTPPVTGKPAGNA